MQTLQIDPPLPFVLPRDQAVRIALVGCGGTGSHLAFTLARLASHCRDAGLPPVELVFIDGDHVEHKNVGRQLFAPFEVGQNKAQTLAGRLAAALGLRITAIPEMATPALLLGLAPPNRGEVLGILVGAVDGADGRIAIKAALETSNDWRVWLDCGNHEASGQVCAGTTTTKKGMAKALALAGLCAALPAPSLQYPELLTALPPAPRQDCAAAAQDNAQSLMVNQMMAAIGGEYLYNLVVRRRLTTFRTVVDLGSLTMRSDPITARTIASVLEPPKKRRRAA